MSAPSSPRPRFWSVFVLATLAAGLTTSYVLGVYLPSFNTPHTRIEGVRHAQASPSNAAISRRLIFVVMDGLSFDLARELDDLASLRREGAMRQLVPPFPTYTSPALVSFMTGLDPEDHGIRLNGRQTGVIGLDTVTRAARDAGTEILLAKRGWDPFEEVMFPSREPNIPLPLRAPKDTLVIEGWARFSWLMFQRAAGRDAPAPLDPATPSASARSLELVYLGEIDEAGHHHGGASAQYREEAHRASAIVSRIASSLDAQKDTLVLVSDHAHLPEGGHGGAEPSMQRAFFLAWGRGIRRGADLEPRPTRDVAPTLSVLAGLRAPTSSLGRPMLDVFSQDEATNARVFAGPFTQSARFACNIHSSGRCEEIDVIAGRLASGDASAIPLGENLLDDLTRDRSRNVVSQASIPRFSFLGAIVASFLLALALRRRATVAALRAFASALPVVVVHIGAYAAVLAILGHRLTFSTLAGERYNRDTTLAGAAAFVGTILLLFFSKRFSARPVSFALIAGTFVPVALVAAWVGADHAVVCPPISGALLFLIAPVALSGAGTAAVWRVFEVFRPAPAGPPTKTPDERASEGGAPA